VTAAAVNRARAIALRLVRESGWAGPVAASVTICGDALTVEARPAHVNEPLPDSPAPAAQEVSDVEQLAERIRARAARRP
jgi:hypothetical protein